MSTRVVILAILWLAAFAGALAADGAIAQFNREHGWEKPPSRRGEPSSPKDLPRPAWTSGTHRLAEILKIPGTYWTTAAIALAVLALHRDRLRAAGIIALAGALTGVNSIIKWIVGRHRPVTGADPFDFQPFAGGLPGLFGAESNLSFPSGHACLAFANAAALAILLPRWRWAFFAIATATAVERVVENAHFASDAVAGAALGVLCAHFAHAACSRWICKSSPAVAIQPAAH
jgi:membrane-associated phospholipid phosphatase